MSREGVSRVFFGELEQISDAFDCTASIPRGHFTVDEKQPIVGDGKLCVKQLEMFVLERKGFAAKKHQVRAARVEL